jgi:NAD(P)H-flavin reductase
MERTAVRGRLTWQTAAVTSVTRETASVITIQLDPPDWPGHRAGQHLDVRLTADDGYQAEREYSIASAPGEPPAITVERLEGGEVSPYLTGELHAQRRRLHPRMEPRSFGSTRWSSARDLMPSLANTLPRWY